MQKTILRLAVALLVVGPGLAAGQTEEEYAALLKQVDGLTEYNALMQRQIATQERQIMEMREAIGMVPDLERQVPPLLERMVEGLQQFISLDIPFLLDERNDRLATLQLLVENATVSDAEKFRRVLEAWEIENEYGRDVQAYTGQLEIDGTMRDVDFLRIGRVGLYYQTQDLALVGAWDKRQKAFVSLGTEQRNSIRQAIRMAQNTTAPDMVLLPITPPENQ